MNKKQIKRLAKIAFQLPDVYVTVMKTVAVNGTELKALLKEQYGDEPIPPEKLLVGGKPVKNKDNYNHRYPVREKLDHVVGLKAAYMKDGVKGTEGYCAEITRHHLGELKKQREKQRDLEKDPGKAESAGIHGFV